MFFILIYPGVMIWQFLQNTQKSIYQFDRYIKREGRARLIKIQTFSFFNSSN
jgi:hypothetical protein